MRTQTKAAAAFSGLAALHCSIPQLPPAAWRAHARRLGGEQAAHQCSPTSAQPSGETQHAFLKRAPRHNNQLCPVGSATKAISWRRCEQGLCALLMQLMRDHLSVLASPWSNPLATATSQGSKCLCEAKTWHPAAGLRGSP